MLSFDKIVLQPQTAVCLPNPTSICKDNTVPILCDLVHSHTYQPEYLPETSYPLKTSQFVSFQLRESLFTTTQNLKIFFPFNTPHSCGCSWFSAQPRNSSTDTDLSLFSDFTMAFQGDPATKSQFW